MIKNILKALLSKFLYDRVRYSEVLLYLHHSFLSQSFHEYFGLGFQVMNNVPHSLPSGQKMDAKRIEIPQELYKIFIGGIPQGVGHFRWLGMLFQFLIEFPFWKKNCKAFYFAFVCFCSFPYLCGCCVHCRFWRGGNARLFLTVRQDWSRGVAQRTQWSQKFLLH